MGTRLEFLLKAQLALQGDGQLQSSRQTARSTSKAANLGQCCLDAGSNIAGLSWVVAIIPWRTAMSPKELSS
jgi:hypothetical protein